MQNLDIKITIGNGTGYRITIKPESNSLKYEDLVEVISYELKKSKLNIGTKYSLSNLIGIVIDQEGLKKGQEFSIIPWPKGARG